MNRTTLALAFLAVLVGAPGAHGAVEYTFTDLSTLGGMDSGAGSINDAGQIVGNFKVGASTNVFRTAPNSPINPATDDLGTLGGTWASAAAINASGHIVGESQDAAGNYRAFRTAGAALVPGDDMGTFGGTTSFAKDINDLGQAVGSGETGGGVYHAFRTAGNTLVPGDYLGTLGGTESRANGINASGQVTGDSKLLGSTVRHAFRTAANSDINPQTDDLGSLVPGDFSTGTDINNAGQVVGYAGMGDGRWRAFCTAPNSPIDPATDNLGSLGGDKSDATAINSHGVVVGWSWIAPGSTTRHAFLYRGSLMEDLNDLVDLPGGWTLTGATDINDAGQIVGSGTLNSQYRGFLLTPIPEPCTLVLLCMGAVLCPRRRRRKATQE